MSNVNEEVVNEIVEVEAEEIAVAEPELKGIKGFVKKHPFWTGVITATGVGGLIVGGALVVGALSKTNAETEDDTEGDYEDDVIGDVVVEEI